MGRTRVSDCILKDGTFVCQNIGSSTWLEASNQITSGEARTIYDDGPTKFRQGQFAIHPVKQWTKSCTSNALKNYIIQLYSDPKYGGTGWNDYLKFDGYPLRAYANMRDYGGFTPEYPQLADLVRTAAAARAASPVADVGLMLAEAGQTASFLKDSMSLVLMPWRHFHKIPSYIKSVKRQLSYLSSKWLEYRYGLMPLLLDVQSLQDLYIQDTVRSVDEIRKSSAKKYREKILILNENGGYTRTAHMWTMNWNYRVHQEYQVTCHVYYRVTDADSASRLGMSIQQLPSLAWELVPYSFVVDWVFNIGDWLKASLPRPDHVHLGVSVGYKTITTSQATLTGLAGWGGNFRSKTGLPVIQATDLWTSFTRVINTPLPPFPVANYHFESVKHALDGASLIWQKIANIAKR